ncbi:MAG: TIR domain-containing protein [Desulfobacteraceae bacterium]|nr:TIR domain-containing protein [Desulfobacteraceae bacterium]
MVGTKTKQELEATEKKIYNYLDTNIKRAVDTYWQELGGHAFLGNITGDFIPGYRVASALLKSCCINPTRLEKREINILKSECALFSMALGKHSDSVDLFAGQIEDWELENAEKCQVLSNLSAAYFFSGQLPKAIESARKAISTTINRERLYFAWSNIGHACFYQGLLQESFTAFNECRKTVFEQKQMLLSSAGRKLLLCLLRANKSAIVLNLLEEANAFVNKKGYSKEIAYCQLIRADALILQGEISDAEKFLETAVEWASEKSCLEILHLTLLARIRLSLKKKKVDTALELARQGVEMYTNYPLATVDFFNFLAQIKAYRGNHSQAVQDATKALEICDDPNVQYYWGRRDALQLLEKLNCIPKEFKQPDNPEFEVEKWFAAFMQNDGQTIDRNFSVDHSGPDLPDDIHQLFSDFQVIGLDRESVDLTIEMLAQHVEDIEYWLSCATALRKKEAYHSSFYHSVDLIYQAAMKRFKDNHRLIGNLGILYQKWGRYDDALTCQKRALGLCKDYYFAWHNKGFCLDMLGRYDEACMAYSQALKIDDTKIISWRGLGNSSYAADHLEKALDVYQKIVDMEPSNKISKRTLALIYLKLKKKIDLNTKTNTKRLLHPQNGDVQKIMSDFCDADVKKLSILLEEIQPFKQSVRPMVSTAMSAWNVKGLWKIIEKNIDKTLNPLKINPPQIMISYRWETDDQKKWISAFAQNLVERGYKVMFDRFYTSSTAIDQVPDLVSEIVRSAYFIPILTEGYRRRVDTFKKNTGVTTIIDDGVVFDEWSSAMQLAMMGRLKLIGIWLSGPVVPIPFTRGTVVDARNRKDYTTWIDTAFPRIADKGSVVTSKKTKPLRLSAKSDYNLAFSIQDLKAYTGISMSVLQKNIVQHITVPD